MHSRQNGNLKACLTLFAAVMLCVQTGTGAWADETDVQQAAAALLKATVTVRIIPARNAKDTVQNEAAPETPPQPLKSEEKPTTLDLNTIEPEVVEELRQAEEPADFFVSSGVSLGKGRILSFSQVPAHASRSANSTKAQAAKTEYRVTLSDGEQAAAQPRVIDQYSGLILLEIDRKDLPGLKVAEDLPAIGGTVLSASAAGIEKPLVSLGILSGFDRTLPGASLPPMVQCDISTTEASSGAALIDAKQNLIGVIAAIEATNQQFGWSFAIGYQHVRRVLEAYQPDELIILARQRAVVGLKLGPGPREGTVLVEHVLPGGPADLAGIRKGEMVLEAEGRKIRSAYQAVAIILKRMPGDEMNFVLGTEKKQRTVRVKLGGGGTVPTTPDNTEDSPYQVGPQVQIRVVGPNRYEVSNRRRVSELNVNKDAEGQAQRKPVSETELLMRQLQAYQDLIVVLQKERLEREAKEQEQLNQLDALRKELKELKQQQKETSSAAK